MQTAEESIRGIISIENLHKVVNAGQLSELRTGGVIAGEEIYGGQAGGEYTIWKLDYIDGHREMWYTLN